MTEEKKQKPQSLDLELLDDDDVELLTFVCSDGKTFAVNKKYALISQVFKASMEDDPDVDEIPLAPEIKSEVVSYLVDFMNIHQGIEPEFPKPPLKTNNFTKVVSDQRDAEFLETVTQDNNQMLYDVMCCANQYGINSLLHLCCAKVASFIKGQPVQKMATVLAPQNIGSSFIRDEEKKSR